MIKNFTANSKHELGKGVMDGSLSMEHEQVTVIQQDNEPERTSLSRKHHIARTSKVRSKSSIASQALSISNLKLSTLVNG